MTSYDDMATVIFSSKSVSTTQIESFTHSPRIAERINELQAMTLDEESASAAQELLAPLQFCFSAKK